MFDYLEQFKWLLTHLGSGNNTNDGLVALTWQDTLLRYTGNHLHQHNFQKQHHTPFGIIHFYYLQHPTVLLGPRDMQLPRLKEGIQFLRQLGYAVHLRAHGGLAVISDPGVLNISLISDTTLFPLSIDEAYLQMVRWVQEALLPLNIFVTYEEVTQSYCPGKFDLVVNHKKIGGIAQRRFKNSVTTAAYLAVNGNQEQRCQTIRSFYSIAQANHNYPQVDANVMTTISNVSSSPISIATFEKNLLNVITSYTHLDSLDENEPDLHLLYHDLYPKTLQRNTALII